MDLVLLVVGVGYGFEVDVLELLVWIYGDSLVLGWVIVNLVYNVIVYGGGCGIICVWLDMCGLLEVSD